MFLSVLPTQEECRSLRALLADALASHASGGGARRTPQGIRLRFHGYVVTVQPCGQRRVAFAVSGNDGILEQGVLSWTRDGLGAVRCIDGQ
jgi:hypothetical protein